jgi:cell division protein FtsB
MSPTTIPQRWVVTGLCCLLAALFLFTTFGERGILHIRRLKEEKRDLDEKNYLLQKENSALRERIKRLRHDNLFLEKIAREELGLVRPGEIIYRFAAEQRKRNRPFSDLPAEPDPSSEQTGRR